ncbi:MAG: SpoIIE family protein phosphatase [Methyloprofundus sp.]|nr:SpoIIE family protein phosphatase [Methyloprofundus sp.]
MKILIVDDQKVNRLLLKKILEKTGSELLFAENGLEAVSVFQQDKPDLILMDMMMPIMDGAEAVQKIRAIKVEKNVQIIVISALSDEASVVKGLNAGANDYIGKPFNAIILKAKVDVARRMALLQEDLLANKQRLQEYHNENERELDFSMDVFEKIIAKSDLQDSQLDYWIKPSRRFSGDLISAKRVSDSQLYFILADSTGHGLSAALPTIIVSQLFQSMVKEYVFISAIVKRINARLKQDLPLGHFVALAVGMVDTKKKSIEIWNGGLPPLSALNNDNKIIHRFVSKHVSCGILNADSFDATTEQWHWTEASELFLCSDGVTDVVDQDGNILGDDTFMEVLLNTKSGKRISEIKQFVEQFVDPKQEQDDVSCLVVYCPESAA